MSEAEPRADSDAERALIGGVLMDQRILNDLDPLQPEDFYQPAHEALWKLLLDEWRSSRPVDVVSIAQVLRSKPIPGVAGTYLHECTSVGVVAGSAQHYANMISGLALLRKASSVARAIHQTAQGGEWTDAAQIIDNARAELDATASAATGIRVRTWADALRDAVEVWDAPASPAYRTGWSDLDLKLNGGWHPGQLTIVGARPAVGKTLVAGCAAVAAHEYGAGFFSLEMREDEVVARMAAAAQGIDVGHLNRHQLDGGDWDKVGRLAQRSKDWKIFMADRSRMTMADIRAHVRSWRRAHPIKVIFIDYLQLVTPADRSESRERQVSRIAEDCKHLAKEFDIHVVALAQVNRGSTAREDKRPTMSDLRESGGIEAFADNIILLHRDEKEESEIEFIVAKNRHGQTGAIRLAWRPQFAAVNGMASDPHDRRHGMEPR